MNASWDHTSASKMLGIYIVAVLLNQTECQGPLQSGSLQEVALPDSFRTIPVKFRWLMRNLMEAVWKLPGAKLSTGGEVGGGEVGGGRALL